MSKSDTLENGLLALIFNGTTIDNIADNAGTGPLTGLIISLHTADPGEDGDQTTNEAAYTAYSRTTSSRSSSDWSVSGSTASNVLNVTFTECSGDTTSTTVTHFGIGSTTSGAGVLYYSGALTTPLAVSAGITPYFPAGTLTVNED